MKIIHSVLATILIIITTFKVVASCESNVDNIQTLYINGMFTSYSDAIANKNTIVQFISENLATHGFNPSAEFVHNNSEWILEQALQVLHQKIEDNESTEAIFEFINNDSGFLDSLTDTEQVQDYLQSIQYVYDFSANEEDAQEAIAATEDMLDSCSRIVLITHSQGNFYANVIMNSIYSSYTCPSGYSITDYPMLGNMQIASPVNYPGGAISLIYPQIIGHITNNNDLIMGLVRNTMGATDSNYESEKNDSDFSGHGLEVSYLEADGQSAVIASELKRIAYDLVPYPMQAQISVASSAINSYGHSSISSVLDIEFSSGSVYRYDGVNKNTANNLNSASSTGGYFNAHIRGNYPHVQIE